MSCPSPGQANTASISTVPFMNATTSNPICVAKTIAALRSTWRNAITCSRRPFARATTTYCLANSLRNADWRISVVCPSGTIASARAGNASCLISP